MMSLYPGVSYYFRATRSITTTVKFYCSGTEKEFRKRSCDPSSLFFRRFEKSREKERSKEREREERERKERTEEERIRKRQRERKEREEEEERRRKEKRSRSASKYVFLIFLI
ncbi:hypothetical protein PUN28_020902 [Cardiocondyla obscurior]|uniref:Uncharacterized protein n=1 Tax=Cardiocondyla obscurior TaxID=286306 RepID=A0AAW2E9A6_9HYME